MSIAPQSIVSPRSRRSRRRSPASSRSPLGRGTKATPKRNLRKKSFEQKVQKLPDTRKYPTWLRSLLVMQKSSALLTYLLIGITLAVYGWCVYNQKLWSTEYRKLSTLQSNERHLTSTNEILKNYMAQQAENESNGLVLPTQNNSLFLPPAPQRKPVIKPAPRPEPDPASTLPLGY